MKKSKFVFGVLYASMLFALSHARQCTKDDFHYEYTTCDSAGGRWRVSVPKNPDLCSPVSAPEPPVRGQNCEYTCEAGQYLDMAAQKCTSCPAGTFSLGGGTRFDAWETLPPEFNVHTEIFASFFGDAHDELSCNRSTWTPKGHYISSLAGDCASVLVYSATLVKPGHVTFEYQYTDQHSIFHFTVKNNQCQTYSSSRNSKWPTETEEGKWGTMTVALPTGLNVLTWKTIGIMSQLPGRSTRTEKPTIIRKIEVEGVAYTSQCTKCRNGTYSGAGAKSCTLCDVNTYSARGAETCTKCNEATEYAERGASKCTPRPACKEYDYYMIHTPCDANKKTTQTYKWIQPQICRADLQGSVKLPKTSEPKDCPPCNPGQHYINGSGCQNCPENHYSDGLQPCQSCPASTSPVYGIDYKFWNVMPSNMTANCISMDEDACGTEATWVPAGNHIHTQFGHNKESYLVLILKIDGFRGKEDPAHKVEVGMVTFTFETICKYDCDFLFLSDANGRSDVVKEWTGPQKESIYHYNVMSTKPLVLTWAFQLTANEEERSVSDMAKIYNIKVTNTLHGGATTCQKCPMGVHKDGCIPCPSGHYIEKNTTSCQPCPMNTVIRSGNEWGIESCQECGSGLSAMNGKTCTTDCKFTDPAGHVYDFTPVQSLQFMQGSPLFTASGTQYYHGFNISLCANDKTKVTCTNNITSKGEKDDSDKEVISSMICRSTMVPQRDSFSVVTTQAVSVADYLTKIETNLTHDSKMHDIYKKEGIPMDGMEKDVHFFYKSESKTDSCPDGRSTIISLRCDPKQDGQGEISLPPKCPDGTCDGCTFHFLWRTQHACHVCSKKDYEKIVGECVDGEQVIHYNIPTDCYIQGKAPKNTKQKCTLKLSALPFELQIAIPAILVVGVILLICLVVCWQRNRKLEYKYMKLVEGTGPNSDAELPGVDSCALEDGEEEQFDSVSFKTKGKGLFSKFTRSRNRDDENPFETRHTEKIPLT